MRHAGDRGLSHKLAEVRIGQCAQALWQRLPPLLRYAATGGLAAAVDIGGFAVLAGLLPGVLAPAAASFLLAAAVNYRVSAAGVFGSEWRNARQAGRFLMGACLGLAVNAGATTALAAWTQWPPLAAKLAGVGLDFGFNFQLNARWAFKKADAGRPEGRPTWHRISRPRRPAPR